VGSPKQARVGAPDVTSGEREEWERQKAAWKSTDTTMTKMWATKDGLAAVLESKVDLLQTEMKRVKCDEEKNKRARITMGKQLEQLEQEKATMGKSLAQRDAKIKTLEANVAARESDAMNTDTMKPSAEQSGVATMKLCIIASCKVFGELTSMRDEFDMEKDMGESQLKRFRARVDETIAQEEEEDLAIKEWRRLRNLRLAGLERRRTVSKKLQEDLREK
jgi:hypothetical protein